MLPEQTGQHSPSSITAFMQNAGEAHITAKHLSGKVGRWVPPMYCPIPTANNPNKSIIHVKEFMFYI
jgi:hypothetical protein